MTRENAESLIDHITLSDIRAMFQNAQAGITDWNAPSKLNKDTALGTSFNILSAQVNRESPHFMRQTERARLHRIYMLMEFGEWLPGVDQRRVA